MEPGRTEESGTDMEKSYQVAHTDGTAKIRQFLELVPSLLEEPSLGVLWQEEGQGVPSCA